MSLSAGRLRHRITIEKQIPGSRDPETGLASATRWSAVVEDLAAEVVPVSVREFIAAQSMQSQIVARITIRYRDGLDATMRIKHRGKIYNPQGWLPDPDSGLEYLTAPCSQGVNAGD
jgi:SPP1 family predicted phage head-tail adaptor